MLLATGFHVARGEFDRIISTTILGLLAALIAYGRWRIAPGRARSPHAVTAT